MRVVLTPDYAVGYRSRAKRVEANLSTGASRPYQGEWEVFLSAYYSLDEDGEKRRAVEMRFSVETARELISALTRIVDGKDL